MIDLPRRLPIFTRCWRCGRLWFCGIFQAPSKVGITILPFGEPVELDYDPGKWPNDDGPLEYWAWPKLPWKAP